MNQWHLVGAGRGKGAQVRDVEAAWVEMMLTEAPLDGWEQVPSSGRTSSGNEKWPDACLLPT